MTISNDVLDHLNSHALYFKLSAIETGLVIPGVILRPQVQTFLILAQTFQRTAVVVDESSHDIVTVKRHEKRVCLRQTRERV